MTKRDDLDDYDVISVKISKSKNKEDNNSSDKLGPGGRRDKTGKLSELYKPLSDEEKVQYDKQIFEENKTKIQKQINENYNRKSLQIKNQRKQQYKDAVKNRVTSDLLDVGKYYLLHPNELIDNIKYAGSSIRSFIFNVGAFFKQKPRAVIEAEYVESRHKEQSEDRSITYADVKKLFQRNSIHYLESRRFLKSHSDGYTYSQKGELIVVKPDEEHKKLEALVINFPQLKQDTSLNQWIIGLSEKGYDPSEQIEILTLLAKGTDKEDE